jgi:hypothetical protein
MGILKFLFSKPKKKYEIDKSVLEWEECGNLGSEHWFTKKAKENLKNKKDGEYFAKGKEWHYKALRKNGKTRYYWRLRKGKAKKWVYGNQIIYTPRDFRNPFEP